MADLSEIQQLLPARYRLMTVIGHGGMGTVYLVRDRLRDMDVALKHISNIQGLGQLDSQQAGTFRTALTHEFRVLAALRHPNVVSVLDYGFDAAGTPYFTMEWLAEGTPLLRAALNLPRAEQLNLFVQLLRALIYIHRHGVVHHDLKPNNILVVPNNGSREVKVLDFGLAIPVEGTSTTAGTLPYLAPESIRGGQVGIPGDLYAVGILLYEVLLGRHPFHEAGAFLVSDLIHSILYDRPQFPARKLPGALEAVLTTLLAKRPEDRYANARATILALSEAVQTPYEVETLATRDSLVRTIRFVGRDWEFALLRNAVMDARKGEGSTWLIGGESGVGKSRLMDEVRIEALTKGMEVLIGQAREEGAIYQDWLEIIRALVLAVPLQEDDLAVLGILDLNLSGLIERPLPLAPELNARETQERLIAVITRLITGLKQPVLMVLEDLHWATEESLNLFQHIASQIDHQKVLLAGTYRDDEKPYLSQRMVAAKVMKLPRLEPAAVSAMIAQLIGDMQGRAELIEVLEAETEGNAFFLVEVMRILGEQAGELETVSRMAKVDLPEHIRRIWSRRLDRLSSSTMEVLEAAAVAGRIIHLPLLNQLFPDRKVEAVLQEAAEYHVTEWREGRWRFEHNRLREQIIELIPEERRKKLHDAVANGLEQIYQDDSMGRQFIPIIALNWEAAGESARALPHLITLAQDWFRVAAFEEALSYVQRAINCLPSEDEVSPAMARRVMDAYYMQFYAYRQREQRTLLVEVYLEALNLAQRVNLPDLFLRAYQLGADTGALTYTAPLAQTCARRMLDYAQPGSGEAVLATYRLSQGLRMERRFAEAIEVCQQTLDSLDRGVVWKGWNFETSLYSYFAFTSFFDTVNGAGWSFATSLGYCCMMQGDEAGMVRYLRQAHHEMQESKRSPRYAVAMHNLALALQGREAVSEALELATELRQRAPQIFPALTHTAEFLVQICEARLQGKQETAAAVLLELAKQNYDENEIEDGIIAARDARVLFQSLANAAGEAQALDLLRRMNDPMSAA